MNIAELKGRISISDLVGRFVTLEKHGDRHVGHCPFHTDAHPSFEVVDRKGKAFCSPCGFIGDHLDFLAKLESLDRKGAIARLSEIVGLPIEHKAGEVGPGKSKPSAPGERSSGTLELASDYTMPDGTYTLTKLKYRLPDGRKRPATGYRKDPNGHGKANWVNNLDGLPDERIHNLFGAHKLQAWSAFGATIIINEGEAATEECWTHGHPATNTRLGATGLNSHQLRWHARYDEQLQGFESALIIVDRDPVGEHHARLLYHHLKDGGVVPRVRLMKSATTGDKDDIRDHFAAGFDLNDLVDVTEEILGTPFPSRSPGVSCDEDEDDDAEEIPYREERNGIYHVVRIWDPKREEYDEKRTRLTNFHARITEQITLDDGESEEHRLVLSTRIGNFQQDTFDLPAKEFSGLAWVLNKLGANAQLMVGQNVREHARLAIQALSSPVRQRTVFTHTGWREIGGKNVYLTPAGAITGNGLDDNVGVEMAKSLSDYSISPGEDPDSCIRASLALLYCGPRRITAAILATAYLAPLMPFFGRELPDFATVLVGMSGLGKSQISALAQAHFGHFRRSRMPSNFDSSANSIERQCFDAKDALLVVDDFRPSGNRRQVEAAIDSFERILRNMGNRAARQRMQADLTMRRGFAPRGVVMVTAESMVNIQSANSRAFVVEVRNGDFIDRAVINPQFFEAGETIAQLPGAMYEFISWLALHWDQMEKFVSETYTFTRTGIASRGAHARQPSQLAYLLTALKAFFAFCQARNILSAIESVDLANECAAALTESSAEHSERLREQDPCLIFLRCLRTALSSGAAHLESRWGGAPERAMQYGWIMEKNSEGFEKFHVRDKRQGPIGFIDDDYVYLQSDLCFAAAKAQASKSDENLFATRAGIFSQLADEGYIERFPDSDGKNRTTKLVRIGSPGAGTTTPIRVALIPRAKWDTALDPVVFLRVEEKLEVYDDEEGR